MRSMRKLIDVTKLWSVDNKSVSFHGPHQLINDKLNPPLWHSGRREVVEEQKNMFAQFKTADC